MAGKTCVKDPHGTFCGMGTKVILFPDIPVIVKDPFKKMCPWGAWDLYLPARLRELDDALRKICFIHSNS